MEKCDEQASQVESSDKLQMCMSSLLTSTLSLQDLPYFHIWSFCAFSSPVTQGNTRHTSHKDSSPVLLALSCYLECAGCLLMATQHASLLLKNLSPSLFHMVHASPKLFLLLTCWKCKSRWSFPWQNKEGLTSADCPSDTPIEEENMHGYIWWDQQHRARFPTT